MQRRKLLTLLITFMLAMSGCQTRETSPVPRPTTTPGPPSVMIEPEGFVQRVHDPVIAKAGENYYIFHTGGRIPIVCSKDKVVWESCGRVFERNPVWTREVNPNLADIWAPDISFFNDKWHLYYAVSSFGSQESAIGLATNATLDQDSPDYAWEDQGVVLRSRQGDRWNAIDPNLVLDEAGEPWLVWGSYWQGIFMRKIDKSTGLFDSGGTEVHHIANRSGGPDHADAIEAPFIIEHDGLWYLFVSFDHCCQGTNSTYNVRVGRSESVTGPYVDREGEALTEGGGTMVLKEYGQWKGPGHNGILIEDGVYWKVYHAYDANQIGVPKLRIESISWDEEGWPSLKSQTE